MQLDNMPMPEFDRAAGQHIAWMLRGGAAWWDCFGPRAGVPEAENSPPAMPMRERLPSANPGLIKESC
jgi:hypothetical protein